MRNDETRARMIGLLLAMAMVAAPVLALLFSPEAALAVGAVGLGATSYLAYEAGGAVAVGHQRALRIATGVNALLALLCLAVLIGRLV